MVSSISDKDPQLLLDQLRHSISSNTCRQFAVSCCRRIWNHLAVELRAAVEVAEGVVEGRVGDDVRVGTKKSVELLCGYVDGDSSAEDRFAEFGSEAVLNCLFGDGDYPPIPTYAVTCAIAAAVAVQEVVYAEAELRGATEEECQEAARTEREWQHETLLFHVGSHDRGKA